MALRNAKPITWAPKGLSDSVDGTNSFPGAMAALVNLIPDPSTDNVWVPRPAATQVTDFTGFSAPGVVSALLVVGNIAYGMIASTRNAGKDEPFAYNLLTNAFESISGVTNANTPTSPATTGDWVPPIMAVVGSRIIVTHPGFAGGANPYFGWLDISGFSDATHIGDTHNGTSLVDNLSANVLQAGWNVGMTITGPNIPANTTIIAIAANGLSLSMSANATASAAGSGLTVAGGTATAPQWGAGNVNGFPLLFVPVSVAQMAGRAYYAVGNGVVLSDSGNATQVTNATQVLLFNNGVPVTALGPLPLASPLTGGIVQAIVAFQGVTAMQVITGDPTTSDLAVNLAKAGTGTLAPLSITPFNEGLAFISPEGLRLVNFYAQISNPVGSAGQGVSLPFIYAINPSRICMAANADTLRVSVQDGHANGQPHWEYWLDLTRKSWSGPHTFPATLIQPWAATFLVVGQGIAAKLWRSDPQPLLTSSYVENGTQLTWIFQTVLLPDRNAMCMYAIIETAFAAAFPAALQASMLALDDMQSVLDVVQVAGSGAPPTLWGFFLWGSASWGNNQILMLQRRVPWHVPIVFKQGSLRLSGSSLAGLELGNLYLKLQQQGYMIENDPLARQLS